MKTFGFKSKQENTDAWLYDCREFQAKRVPNPDENYPKLPLPCNQPTMHLCIRIK